MRYTKQAVLALLFIVLTSTHLMAQSASTSLRGVVKDPSGAAVSKAAIHLTNTATNATADTTTNGAGEYSFQQLQPGDYTITITVPDVPTFGIEVLKARLLVAQPATVNAKLAISKDTTVVDVTTTSQTINTTDASIGNSIGKETIDSLPSEGRRIETFLSLQPGVLYLGEEDILTSTESRNGVVSGARADQTNLTLDGLDNNDQFVPAAFTGVLRTPIDAVDEFRVTTSNANADTGRSSGGQANVVTRSGTNIFHGALYEYNRNNWGLAKDWFTKTALVLHRNIYGASLGGPILKDKLFLFANYEALRKNEGSTSQRLVPGPTLRAGTVAYTNTGSTTTTLSSSQIASMDADCTTATGTGTCPWGRGPDPNALAFMNSYPVGVGPNQSQDPLNIATLTFGGSQPTVQNTYVTRMDYNLSEKHRFFVRALMMNDAASLLPYFPGQPPQSKNTNNSKGIGGGYIWAPTDSLVNAFRYGFTRQSVGLNGAGTGQGAFAQLRGIDLPVAPFRSSFTQVPLHNFTDDVSWTKGHHTIQAGANLRHYDFLNKSDVNSYDFALANASYLPGAGIAGTGNFLDPGDVDPSDSQNYDYAVTAVTGLMTQVTNNYNYIVSKDGQTASLLGQGFPVSRDYRENEFEWYLQDQWKVKPNLTVTVGIRHTILQTPWEVNGQQVQPNIDLHQWFETRGEQAKLGNSVQPDFSFAASGKAHNGKPFYPMNWKNFAPRLAFAYSPAFSEGWLQKLTGGAGKMSIRAGFGIYYDHFGEGVVQNFANNGSFSLSTQLTNAPGSLDVPTAPRFTGVHDIPAGVNPVQGPITYPYAAPIDGFQITYGLDDHLKTPYSEVVDFSVQRELPWGFTVEGAYVGRFGRHLLQALDLAQPLDLVDPASGSDYYSAVTQMDRLFDQGFTDPTTIAPIPYFEHMFADAAGIGAAGDGTPGFTATQNIYNNIFLNQNTRGNETNLLFDTDVFCDPGCGGQLFRYFQDQYSSLYGYSSVGSASYNAGQFTLRHPMSHGVEVDINYTYSRAIDLGSDTESNYYAANPQSFFGQLQDAFHPGKNRAVSDFNTTHLITADWVLNLPVGRGKAIGGGMSRWMDMAIGGWQLAGLAHISSGLPIAGVLDSAGWATNWDIEGWSVQTGPIKMRKHQDANGSMEAFDNPTAALANQRLPYGGEAGERNKFIGDGYFDVDSGLHKSFAIYDRLRLSLACEVYNVTNSVRFDSHENNAATGFDPSTFGEYIPNTLTQPRRIQLAARLDF